MNGWTATLLRVDLGSETAVRERIPGQALLEDLGGRGLAGRMLEPLVHLEPDDPAAPLCLFTGPLAGTDAPGCSALCMAARSPLTGTACDDGASCGLAQGLKRAGLDGVVVTGRAQSPVRVAIEGEAVRFEDARELAGLPLSTLRARLGADAPARGSMAAPGPAAWAGSLLAGVGLDTGEIFGRGGLGVCWARKNLACLTADGPHAVRVADPGALAKAREDVLRLAAASPALSGGYGFSRFGTGALLDLMDARSMTPTDNFRATRFDKAAQAGAVRFARAFQACPASCPGCPVGCGKRARDGRPLPGFDAASHFTALLGLADMDLAVEANALCADLGLDPVSAAVTLACHAEVTGERLTPGRVLDLLEGMGTGGDPGLGQGAARYAASLGRPEAAMTVKGLELGACDPRGAYGLALSCAVSTCGGRHDRAGALAHEVLRKPVATDRFSFLGKARIIKLGEDAVAAAASLPVCPLMLLAASLEEYAGALQAVTGQPFSARDLQRAGGRICYRERIMNARLGFTAQEDDLPARFFLPPGQGGVAPGVRPLPRAEFLEARARYFAARGLSPEGLPTRAAARELGLEECLEREGAKTPFKEADPA